MASSLYNEASTLGQRTEVCSQTDDYDVHHRTRLLRMQSINMMLHNDRWFSIFTVKMINDNDK